MLDIKNMSLREINVLTEAIKSATAIAMTSQTIDVFGQPRLRIEQQTQLIVSACTFLEKVYAQLQQ